MFSLVGTLTDVSLTRDRRVWLPVLSASRESMGFDRLSGSLPYARNAVLSCSCTFSSSSTCTTPMTGFRLMTTMRTPIPRKCVTRNPCPLEGQPCPLLLVCQCVHVLGKPTNHARQLGERAWHKWLSSTSTCRAVLQTVGMGLSNLTHPWQLRHVALHQFSPPHASPIFATLTMSSNCGSRQ
jgi:hypothetical protein